MRRSFEKISYILPLVIQFSFGGIFSGYVVFYSRGGTLAGSWIFLLLLVFFLIGNEFFREKYHQLNFKLTIYYIAIFSFLIFFVPVVVKKIGAWIFLGSGILSLLVMYLFLLGLKRIYAPNIKNEWAVIMRNIATVFILINILYFTNVIPPLPLSLKQINVAHGVTRVSDGSYIVEIEKHNWFDVKEYLTPTFNRYKNESITIFTAVFSPTDLNTKIIHHWQYFDRAKKDWVTTDKLTFEIFGGRDGGSRGFTTKQSIQTGKWRVDVETERGQLIGREVFSVVNTQTAPETEFQEQ
jgi:hypothetical protein